MRGCLNNRHILNRKYVNIYFLQHISVGSVRNNSNLSYDEHLSIRNENLGPNYKHGYKTPILFTKGFMQWLYDHSGKKYLDMYAGIVTVSVGHCHPKVSEALKKQTELLWHAPTIYMHPKIQEYAKKLTEKMPGDLKTVYFMNSGSEANDLAMLISRLYTNNFEVISLRNAYHGGSPYTMGLIGQSPWRYTLPGLGNGIHHAMNPDPYLGLWGGKHCRKSLSQTSKNCDCEPASECQAENKYIEQLEEILKYSVANKGCAAMFAESIQGGGGCVQFPKNYIKKAAKLIRDNGGIFISDEVQSGFGRTGDHFWGFQDHEIIPDIVTMAKGIGNGFPLAALVTTKKIAEVLKQALIFNTFGGNPLACTVGMAVLDVIEEEQLQQNSLECGEYFIKGLIELQKKHSSIIGDVRGKGLMLGVELVSDPDTRKPLDGDTMKNIKEECRNLGVIFGCGGFYGTVIRIKPPMCVNTENITMALDVLDKAIQKYK